MNEAEKWAGNAVCFVGNECHEPTSWTVEQFVSAAKTARSYGFDSVACKVYNGTQKWYGTPANLKAIKDAVNAEAHCGFLGFGYHYAPLFGQAQAEGEAAIAAEVKATIGAVCPDLETEFNTNTHHVLDPVSCAKILAAELEKVPGFVYLTSWANPDQQAWDSVVQALDPCVSAWVPQEYDNFLATQEYEYIKLTGKTIMPAVDLTQEFGPNNPTAIVQRGQANGHNTFWVWEYLPATRNPTLARAVCDQTHHITQPPPPQTGWKNYVVQPGDTLISIATELHLGNWYDQLYKPNADVIEQAARDHGYASSGGGDLIFPGTVLRYQ